MRAARGGTEDGAEAGWLRGAYVLLLVLRVVAALCGQAH